MKEALLCLDIGNTSTSYGVYYQGRFKRIGYTQTYTVPRNIHKLMKNVGRIPVKSIIISSVVPQIASEIEKSVRKNIALKLWVVGKNLKPKIKHNYHSIKKLGNDRLVTAYGAMRLYGAPLLIFDFGTALTCDYISSKGVFEGGLIIPGPEISFKALTTRAELLPEIPFPISAKGVMGHDTKSCLKLGVLEGYGAMTDELVNRYRRRLKKKPQVIATGGLAKVIYQHSSRIDILDPALTLKSLVLAFKDKTKNL